MAYRLQLEHVKREALKAYNEDRLLAQDLSYRSSTCVYKNPNGSSGCAIGVALPPEVISVLCANDGYHLVTPVRALANFNLIEVDPTELETIAAIQLAHDAWCWNRVHDGPADMVLASGDFFLSLLV